MGIKIETRDGHIRYYRTNVRIRTHLDTETGGIDYSWKDLAPSGARSTKLVESAIEAEVAAYQHKLVNWGWILLLIMISLWRMFLPDILNSLAVFLIFLLIASPFIALYVWILRRCRQRIKELEEFAADGKICGVPGEISIP